MIWPWQTQVDGLSVRSAWAWTDTTYSEDFINATGENLKGEKGAGSADITGFVGFTFDRALEPTGGIVCQQTRGLQMITLGPQLLNPFVQDSFLVLDAAISVYSDDERHQLSLIGRNIGDEYYIIGGGAIPGRTPIDNTGANARSGATTPLGRTISLQYRLTL